MKENWKSLCKRTLILPLWLVVIMFLVSAAGLISVFFKGWETHIYAYVIYVFSFYTLMVIVIAGIRTIPDYYRSIREKVYENKYANRYLTDVAYKTHISLYSSLIINLLYIITNAVSAIIYNTHWFAIFAVYYGIMAVMRVLLVNYFGKQYIGRSRLGELRRSRICAYILMTINIILSAVVLMMVYNNRGFQYKGYFIYIMAMYTFYVTTAAIINIVKYRKYQSPVMSMTKIIKLTQSMFSMLFLETAMFSQFGKETSEKFKKIMIMLTGAGICIIVVGMSVYMIIRSSKEIKNIEKMKRSSDTYEQSE